MRPENTAMKIAIVGAGAIGGYLGAKLAHAGEDVTFIARNQNLAAIRQHGFRLILEDGSALHAPTAKAVQDPLFRALDRVSLKTRVVDTPEILAVLGQLPHMESFLNGLYGCKYKARAAMPHALRPAALGI